MSPLHPHRLTPVRLMAPAEFRGKRVRTSPLTRGVSVCLWMVVASVLATAGLGMGRRGLVHADQPDQSTARKPAPREQVLERGQAIWQSACAKCHGKQGEGVADHYADPLVGDASIGELTRLIADTMPEEEPQTCVGEDASAVAAYIHQAFYSEAARIRNRPPRIGLARLTAAQLRQSLADLYGRFEGTPWQTEERGLKGLYFTGARWKNENKKIERVDPKLDFDFGHEGPGEGIDAKDFFIHWQGSLKVDETGTYEIVIRCSCAFVCELGARDRVLINNRVQSGDRTEFRRSVVLTAGRTYPLQIDFYQRRRKTEQPPAQISLHWVPPGGREQLIPQVNLLPETMPGTFSLQAKLPPDDRSYGYDRGIRVDRQWDAATTAAAIEFGQIAIDELWPRYQRKRQKQPASDRERLRTFLIELVETAFRGPLDDAAMQTYVDAQLAAAEDDQEVIKRAVLMTLKSPRFLYPALDRDRSPSQRAANRLTLVLFDSLPADQWLREQAERNQLETEEQIREAAWRMVGDFRTRGKARAMLYQWLNLQHQGEITKDAETFPGFDASLVSDLRSSFDAYVDQIVWSEASDYRQLFLGDWAYTNDRLAAFYGEHWKRAEPGADTFLARSLPDPQRIGILSHPYLMSSLAYHDSTSPIHRGVFLIRHILGRTLRPPQDAFTPLSPDLHPDLTTRERVELQTSSQACQVCHAKINGLGFTLENFDAVGRYRTRQRDKPINSQGRYTNREDQEISFKGPKELAQFLANSDEAHRAFVRRAFQHFVKQPIAAYGPDALTNLTEKFRQHQFAVRQLLVEIAVLAASHAETSTPDSPE